MRSKANNVLIAQLDSCMPTFKESLTLLLHMLFLDHDIIFYFKTTLKKFKKNLSKVLNTFEIIIMENGGFDPQEQMGHFP